MSDMRRTDGFFAFAVIGTFAAAMGACTGGPDPGTDGGITSSSGSSSSGSSSSGSSSGSTTSSSGSSASCSQFPVSGSESGFTYVAEQKSQGSTCACVTENPFGADAGPAGTSCTTYKDCAMNCCTCTNSTRAFGAAVCQNGECTDSATACQLVQGVSFATDSLCP